MMSFNDIMRQASAQQKQSEAELEYLKAKQRSIEQKKTKEIIEQVKKKPEINKKLPEKKEPTLSSVLSSFKIPKKTDPSIKPKEHNNVNNGKVSKTNGDILKKKVEKSSTTRSDPKAVPKVPSSKSSDAKDLSTKGGKPAYSRVNDDLMDLLSSAKHVSKPVNPPSQPKKPEIKPIPKPSMESKNSVMSKSKSSILPTKHGSNSTTKLKNGQDTSAIRKRTSDYTTAKPPPVKRAPPPTSFEEMMKLASENAKKDITAIPKDLPTKTNTEYQSKTAGLNLKKPLNDSKVKSSQSIQKPKESLKVHSTTKPSTSSKVSSVDKKLPSSSKMVDKYRNQNMEKQKASLPSTDKYKTSIPNKSIVDKNRMANSSTTDKFKTSYSSKYPSSKETTKDLKGAVRSKDSRDISRMSSKNTKEVVRGITKDPRDIARDKYPKSQSSLLSRPISSSSRPPPYPSYNSYKSSTSYSMKPPPRRYNSYDEEDDDADSLDDFIDDDIDDSYNSRAELSKVLKNFCRSDKDTWSRREREINLSGMTADFRTIQAEEGRSARIARMEDLMEEQRGATRLG